MALTDTVDNDERAGSNTPGSTGGLASLYGVQPPSSTLPQSGRSAVADSAADNVQAQKTADDAEKRAQGNAEEVAAKVRMETEQARLDKAKQMSKDYEAAKKKNPKLTPMEFYQQHTTFAQRWARDKQEDEAGKGPQASWFGDVLRGGEKQLNRGVDAIDRGVNHAADWATSKMGLADNGAPQTTAGGMGGGMAAGLQLPNIANPFMPTQVGGPRPPPQMYGGFGGSIQDTLSRAGQAAPPPPEILHGAGAGQTDAQIAAGKQPMQVNGAQAGTQQGLVNALTGSTTAPPAADPMHSNQTGAAGAGGPAPTAPFQQAQAGVAHVPGRSVPGQDPAMIDQYLKARNQERAAVGDRGKYDAETAHQLAVQGVFNDNTEQLNFIQRQSDQREREARIDKAQRELDSYKIDPNHFEKHRNVGNRILMGISAGLVGFANSMNKIHGNNILDMLAKEKEDDMDAQKSEKTRLGTATQAAVNAGLRGNDVDTFVNQHITGMGQKALQAITAARQPASVMMAAKQTQAILDQRTAEDNMKLHPYIQPHDVGVGGIPQKAKDAAVTYAKDIVLKSGKPDDYQKAYESSLRTQGYGTGGGTPEEFATGSGKGGARAIAQGFKVQTAVQEIGMGRKAISQLKPFAEQTFGQWSPTSKATVKFHMSALKNAIITAMGNGNAVDAKRGQDIIDALPDMPSHTNFTDANKRTLELADAFLAERYGAMEKTGAALGSPAHGLDVEQSDDEKLSGYDKD